MKLLCHGDQCRKPRCGFARDPSHNPRSSFPMVSGGSRPGCGCGCGYGVSSYGYGLGKTNLVFLLFMSACY